MWIIILPLHSKTNTMSQDTPKVWKIKDDLSNIEVRKNDFNDYESCNGILDLSLAVTCISLGIFALCTLLFTLIN